MEELIEENTTIATSIVYAIQTGFVPSKDTICSLYAGIINYRILENKNDEDDTES